MEEITTTYDETDSESDDGRRSAPKNRKVKKNVVHRSNKVAPISPTTVDQDDILYGVDMSYSQTNAPFPEAGVNIVSGSAVARVF